MLYSSLDLQASCGILCGWAERRGRLKYISDSFTTSNSPKSSSGLCTTDSDTHQSQQNADPSKNQNSPERHILHAISLVFPHLIPVAGLLIVHIERQFAHPVAEAREMCKRLLAFAVAKGMWVGLHKIFKVPAEIEWVRGASGIKAGDGVGFWVKERRSLPRDGSNNVALQGFQEVKFHWSEEIALQNPPALFPYPGLGVTGFMTIMQIDRQRHIKEIL